MSAHFPEHLAALLDPRAYPHRVEAVTLVETHISWILLTGEFAYKIKRPVCLPFIDMRSLERRAFLCHEEVRLNRRFAPDLYLDVCPITLKNGAARLAGLGEPVEYAVKMRQFPRDAELDNLLTQGHVLPAELAEFGVELASVHAGLPAVEPASLWGTPEAIRAGITRNLEECARASAVFGTSSEVNALHFELEHHLDCAAPWMRQRREHGRVRECHGDLHAANIVRIGSRLVPFDGLEFEAAFRWIDVAEEVAFLLADLDARGYPHHAQAFLGGYLARSGDYQACRLLPVYKAHRALVRAKVTALSQERSAKVGEDGRLRRLYRQYLDCAARALELGSPMLIVMTGLSGSGKTWLAERLAPPLAAIHMRSDVERKRLAGLPGQARSQSSLGAGLYTADSTDRVYEWLAAAAEHTLSGGYTTILDATFSRRDYRHIFHMLADRLGVAACLIECQAPQEVLAGRVEARGAQGTDPSEADVEVLSWQRRHWQPLASEEGWLHLSVDTATVRIVDLLQRIEAIRRLHAAP